MYLINASIQYLFNVFFFFFKNVYFHGCCCLSIFKAEQKNNHSLNSMSSVAAAAQDLLWKKNFSNSELCLCPFLIHDYLKRESHILPTEIVPKH